MSPSIAGATQVIGHVQLPSAGQRHTFLTLDAMRGVAALAVVLFHDRFLFNTRAFGHGYLAVDFFFLLSGFVLTYAYSERLEQGWSTLAFLKVRLIRLYPLYLLGLSLGLAFWLLQVKFGKPHASSGNFALALTTNLFMLPATSFQVDGSRWLFPFNFAMWSLFFEVAANVYHALVLRGRGLLLPGVITAMAGLVLTGCAFHQGTLDFGATPASLLYDVPRTIFSYTFGVVLFRLWQRRQSSARHSAWLLLGVLLAALSPRAMQPLATTLFDLGAAIFLFPALVYLGASSTPQANAAKIFRLLGITSYALYAIHLPLTDFIWVTWNKISSRGAVASAPWSGWVTLLSLVAAALAADLFYDLPVRKVLRRYLTSSIKI